MAIIVDKNFVFPWEESPPENPKRKSKAQLRKELIPQARYLKRKRPEFTDEDIAVFFDVDVEEVRCWKLKKSKRKLRTPTSARMAVAKRLIEGQRLFRGSAATVEAWTLAKVMTTFRLDRRLAVSLEKELGVRFKRKIERRKPPALGFLGLETP